MRWFYRTLLSLIPSYFKINGVLTSTDQTDTDLASLQQLHHLVTQWCIANRFLILTHNKDRYVPNITSTLIDDKLCRYVYSMNFKQLCMENYLQATLMLFKDTEYDHTTSRLIDLYIQIVTEIDPRFLNIYINKLIHALNTIYPDIIIEVLWEDTFENYPYIWLLFLIQKIMRNAAIEPLKLNV